MRCPICATMNSMGLLQEYKRGNTVYQRYFCGHCCSEVCFENEQISSVLAINEEGEVRPRARRFWSLGGLEPGYQAS